MPNLKSLAPAVASPVPYRCATVPPNLLLFIYLAAVIGKVLMIDAAAAAE